MSTKPEKSSALNGGGKAPEVVLLKGGPPAGTFSWSSLSCRAIVLIVWGITPLSWFYVAWSMISTAPSSLFAYLAHISLLIYASTEVGFSIYYRYLVHLAQIQAPLPPYGRAFLRQTLSRALEDGMKLEDVKSLTTNHQYQQVDTGTSHQPQSPSFSKGRFSKLSFLDQSNRLARNDPRAIDWRNMFSNWFLGKKWEELRRENVLEWLAWSCYAMSFEDVLKEWEQEGRPILPETVQSADEILNETKQDADAGGKLGFLYQALYMLEARSGIELLEGRVNATSIRLQLDPVRATSRPLAKYLVTGFFNILLQKRAERAGFRRYEDEGLEYLIRIPKDWIPGREETSPTIFIHGLGMGLAQYASLVSYFEQHPSVRKRPLVLLIQPHLSMSFFHPLHRKPPNKEGTVHGMRALVAKWGFKDGINVISHSNGTIVASWLLKDCPDLLKRSCFVDPVTFCLWEPHIAYNFLYRTPKTGIEILMRYFVGEELGIAIMLQRYFDWSANILWFEEIPRPLDNYNTAYFIAEKDAILDASRTSRYLRDHGVRDFEDGGNLRFLRGVHHGESLIAGGAPLVAVLDWLTMARE